MNTHDLIIRLNAPPKKIGGVKATKRDITERMLNAVQTPLGEHAAIRQALVTNMVAKLSKKDIETLYSMVTGGHAVDCGPTGEPRQSRSETGIVTDVSNHYCHDVENSLCYVYVPGLGVQSEQNGSPVMVEYYQGKWWVRVWADINEGDPTHAIELTGAMETERSQP